MRRFAVGFVTYGDLSLPSDRIIHPSPEAEIRTDE